MPTLSVYMTIPLHLLILESIDEIEEILKVLSQAGFAPQWRRLETENDDLAQLHKSADVIVASTWSQFDIAISQAATHSSHCAELASSQKREATDYRLNNQREQLGQTLQEKLQNDKQQLEKELEYRTKFEQLLSHLSTHFINLSLNEIDKAIDSALQEIGEFFRLDRSYIFQRTDSDSTLNKTHEWCTNGIAAKTNLLQTLAEYFADDSQNLATNLSLSASRQNKSFAETECSELAQRLAYQSQSSAGTSSGECGMHCRFPAGTEFQQGRQSSADLDGAFKGRKSIPPAAPPVPKGASPELGSGACVARVEEEVRIPKVRVLGFPQDESAVGFPRNESAVELAREESVGLRPGGSSGSVSTAGTSSDGVAVSGDESPESVRRFSRSANPKGGAPAQAQTILVVPIVLGNLVGVVGFDASHEALSSFSVPNSGNGFGALAPEIKHRFFEGRMVMLKALAELLVSAIKRKRTEKEHQRSEKTIRQEKELAQVTLQSIGDAVITTDWAGKVQYINPVAEKLTGWKTSDAHGRVLPEVFRIIDENSRATAENPFEAVWRSGQIVELINRTVLIARNGTEYAIDVSAAPIGMHQGIMIGTVLVFRDNTQSRSLAHQLSWQATHDTLTELVNRHGFEQHLAKAIAFAQHKETQHALCYLDLDQFKVINDTCGYVAGDELLRQVSVLLRQRIRSTDILARLGGDEFGILLYQCSLQKAEQIANSLQTLIQNFRFTWDSKTFTIGVSIGLVTIDHSSLDVNSLLGAADVACYAAKDKGGNYIQIYRAEDQELARQRGERQWILKIHAALEENRFCLYCQQIAPVAADLGEAHCEVLLRMIDEQGGLVPPMAFIPAAERYNLMPVIDQWVIRTFFASYTQHLGEELRHQPHHVYTINLSGASVNHNQFLDFLKEQFAQYSIPPQSICFEITETTAVANLRQAAQLIKELKQLGCRFALDDFGSGMSSLAYLKNLPVDYLKIDGSFVKNITSDQVNYALVECFNRVGQVMGMKTIAEFVENEATLEMLRSLGVDYAQGYGIAKPCPLAFG